MAAKKKTEQTEFVAYAGGYGLTADGVWTVLPDGYVPGDPAELKL